MYLAHVSLRAIHPDRDIITATIACLIECLRYSGQILEKPSIGRSGSTFGFTTEIPERGSLAPARCGPRVARALDGLRQLGVSPMRVDRLDRAMGSPRPCACRNDRTLIISPPSFSRASPVQCGLCSCPVPLYRLPATATANDGEEFVLTPCNGLQRFPVGPQADYYDLVEWQDAYRWCWSLWIDGRIAERFALRQLCGLDSALTKQGRSLAEDLEKLTGRTVYYDLARLVGGSAAEERKRRCPGCGGRWKTKRIEYGRYQFKCTPCRLLSNMA